MLPATWSRANPIDIIGDAPGKRYAATLEAVVTDPGNDAVLVLNCPTAVAESSDAARATLGATAAHKRPVFTSWLGESAALEARHLFAQHRIPPYETPSEAVQASMHLVRYRRNQEMLRQVPPSIAEAFRPDVERAQAILDRARGENRAWLTEVEAKEALGVPSPPTRTANAPSTRSWCGATSMARASVRRSHTRSSTMPRRKVSESCSRLCCTRIKPCSTSPSGSASRPNARRRMLTQSSSGFGCGTRLHDAPERSGHLERVWAASP